VELQLGPEGEDRIFVAGDELLEGFE